MINLYYLRYFVDTATTKSLVRSAQKNRVSQAAVSQAIRKLEDFFGNPLCTHRRNKFQLTEFGATVFIKAQALFGHYDHFISELGDTKMLLSGNLRLGVFHSFSSSILPSMLSKFRKSYPKIQFTLTIDRPDNLLSRLQDGELDVAIVLDNMDLLAFKKVLLMRTSLGLYRQKSARLSPLAGPYNISSYHYENATIRRQYQKHYSENMPVEIEVGSWEVLIQLTMQGESIGIFPDFLVNYTLLKNHISSVRNTFLNMKYRIYLVRSLDADQAPKSHAFMHFDFFT